MTIPLNKNTIQVADETEYLELLEQIRQFIFKWHKELLLITRKKKKLLRETIWTEYFQKRERTWSVYIKKYPTLFVIRSMQIKEPMDVF